MGSLINSQQQNSQKYKIQIDNLQNELIELKKHNASIQSSLDSVTKPRSLSPSEYQSIDISMEATPAHSPQKTNDAKAAKLEKKLAKASKNMKIVKEKYKELKSKFDANKEILNNRDEEMEKLKNELNELQKNDNIDAQSEEKQKKLEVEISELLENQKQKDSEVRIMQTANKLKQKELEVRITQLLNDLDEEKEQNELTEKSLSYQEEIKNLQQTVKEQNDAQNAFLKVAKNKGLTLQYTQGQKIENEVVAEPGFNMFDSVDSQSRPQTMPHSPNKNQTVIGKKELQKLRKKAEGYTTVLSKARSLKQKNKELKDEMAKQQKSSTNDNELEEMRAKYEKLQAKNEEME